MHALTFDNCKCDYAVGAESNIQSVWLSGVISLVCLCVLLCASVLVHVCTCVCMLFLTCLECLIAIAANDQKKKEENSSEPPCEKREKEREGESGGERYNKVRVFNSKVPRLFGQAEKRVTNGN